MQKLGMLGLVAMMVVGGMPIARGAAARSSSVNKDPFGVLAPFWTSSTMRGESLFFIQPRAAERPRAGLLFKAKKIVQVVQPATGMVYEAGRDYALAVDGRSLILPEGSRIPFKTQAEMYPPLDAPGQDYKDKSKKIFFSEGRVFHDVQVEVSYTHAKQDWQRRKGYRPAGARTLLPKTLAKLHHRAPVKIVLLGDSISAGYNASGSTGAPPHMPAYGDLTALGLTARYGGPVTLKNLSIAGKSSKWGAEVVDAVNAETPDLVIIAFGMNDASGRVPVAEYIANTEAIMAGVRATHPSAEFVLVATMTGNLEWVAASQEHYLAYRDALRKEVAPGVALADMTAMWMELLKSKKFADLTGNGVNHPNDFGHRVYAQVLLELLR